MDLHDRYRLHFAAALVRGRAMQGCPVDLADELRNRPLEQLSVEELEDIFLRGQAAGLKLHKFKLGDMLPRVRRVLGALYPLAPARLLDVGSGRGALLWPLLDSFPHLCVTAIDRNPQRARDLQAICLGGIGRLAGAEMDVTAMAFGDDSFDGVIMAEVLEHIPNAAAALTEAVRVARRFVILSVPSKADSNPEHIHLFNERLLREMFAQAGVSRVGFDFVPGHLVAVARI